MTPFDWIGKHVRVDCNNAPTTICFNGTVEGVPRGPGDSWQIRDNDAGQMLAISEGVTIIELQSEPRSPIAMPEDYIPTMEELQYIADPVNIVEPHERVAGSQACYGGMFTPVQQADAHTILSLLDHLRSDETLRVAHNCLGGNQGKVFKPHLKESDSPSGCPSGHDGPEGVDGE